MSDWTEPIVVVTIIQAIIAVILAIIAVKQEQARTWRQEKAFLVAHAKKLSETGYGIEIHNQGDGFATNVETLINGKPVSESLAVLNRRNISDIAPKDWITYRLIDNPPATAIDVSITWTDGTGEPGKYEKGLINY